MRKIVFNEETIQSIREYATTHTLMEACNRFTLKPKTLKRVAGSYSIRFLEGDNKHQLPAKKSRIVIPERYRGRSDIIEDGDGYLMCLKPEWYTGRKCSKYVFLHSLIMCEALGLTELPKGYCVHHIDFNPRNNDISNLSLMSLSAHSKLHSMINDLCKVQRSEKIRREDSPETPDND